MKKSIVALSLLSVLGSGSAMAMSDAEAGVIINRTSIEGIVKHNTTQDKKINDNKNAINDNKADLNRNSARIDANENRAKNNETKIDSNASKIENNDRNIVHNGSRIDANGKKINEVEAKVDSNKADLNRNSARIDANENRAKNNETKIDSNASKIENNDRNIVHNGSRIDAIYDNADKVAKDVEAEYNATAKVVEAEYARTTSKIEGNTKAIGELRNDFSKMAQRQDQLEKRTDQLEGKLSNGIAAVGALAAMPVIAGEAMNIGAGVSNYNGSTAIAVGLTKAWENGVAVKAGLAYAQGKFSQKDTMVNAGVSYAL